MIDASLEFSLHFGHSSFNFLNDVEDSKEMTILPSFTNWIKQWNEVNFKVWEAQRLIMKIKIIHQDSDNKANM